MDGGSGSEAESQVARWTPLVHRIVHRYRRSVGLSDRPDLLQVGFLGLWVGLRTYRARRGKLMTWLWTTINREIVDYLRSSGVTTRSGCRRIHLEATPFSRLEHGPSEGQFGSKAHEYFKVLEAALCRNDPEPTGEVWGVVDRSLCPRDALLVRLVYLDGLLQREAARRVGVSQERVSQVLSKAYEKLARRLA